MHQAKSKSRMVKNNKQTQATLIHEILCMLCIHCFICIGKGEAMQSFIVEPQNTSAIHGSTTVLKCKISGRQGQVQWTKDKFALGTDRNLEWYPRYSMIGTDSTSNSIGEYNLQITDIELSDDAIYQCQVGATESVKGIRSQTAKLNVLVPPDHPTIDGQPDIELVKGRPTNVSCRALNGKPAADIIWYMDGKRIRKLVYSRTVPKEDGKRVDTIGIVTLNATLEDAGKRIKCLVQNEAMSEPYFVSATIDVQYVPEVQMTINKSDSIKEYDFLRFTCIAQANPDKISWKWYKNGQEILDETRNILDIPKITRSYHEDTISCEATNDVGSTVIDHKLNVHFGPRFIGAPQHATVDIGKSTSLHCEADGNPTPSIIWTKKGLSHVLGSTETYTINSVRKSDISVYICTATVLGFSEISREIYLLQNGPPRIMSETEQYASKGDTAQVECLTYSAPLPQSIVWLRDGQPINYASSGRFSAKEEDLPFGRKSTLQILNVHSTDYGEFNCSVSNSYGQDIATITLLEKVAPPLPYIIGGVVGSVTVLFVIVLVCVLYSRYKSAETNSVLGSYTDTDSSTEHKKREKSDSPSTLMDQWRQDYNKDFYRYSADYDELNYGKEMKGNNNSYGFIEPCHGNAYRERMPDDEYLSANDVIEPADRYDTLHGYSSFRSTPDPNTRLPPASVSGTKFATNV